jgi:glutathione peroxidase
MISHQCYRTPPSLGTWKKGDRLSFDLGRQRVDSATMKMVICVMIGLAVAMVSVWAAESLYDLQLKDLEGKDTSFKAYQGKVLLVVNVASKCGYTPQYAGLEKLYEKYKERGLVVLGLPCNQFGGQEPGSSQEIQQFCSSRYQVTFPVLEKIEVNGPHRHPLYQILAGPDSPVAGDIRWNFTKFLVGRDGKILKRFESKAAPEAAELVQAVEAALAAK